MKLNVAERLDTHPSLLSRTSNRPKLEDLKKIDLSKTLDDATVEVMISLDGTVVKYALNFLLS